MILNFCMPFYSYKKNGEKIAKGSALISASWASLLSRLCFFYCDMVHLGNTSIYRSQQGLISDSQITPFERVNCNLETSPTLSKGVLGESLITPC